jgi:hypothetical protein
MNKVAVQICALCWLFLLYQCICWLFINIEKKCTLRKLKLKQKLLPVYSMVSTAFMKLPSINALPRSSIQFFGDVMLYRWLSSTRCFEGR